LAGKRICLFGFAFKADTGDTRETPALYIAKRLLEERTEVVITDPKALPSARIDLAECDDVIYELDPYKAATGCDAIAVMTEWKLYANLDYKKIYNSMVKPAFIFDGRNILDHKRLHKLGFNVFPIGKTPLVHF
jgi:UDPglucose 6-dehydrogenase